MNYFQENPNPNWGDIHIPEIDLTVADFELSDFLTFDDGKGFDLQSSTAAVSPENDDVAASGSRVVTSGILNVATSNDHNMQVKKCKANNKKKKKNLMEVGRVAFRTKSELDVMDDGFKWRKYGKKSVKNSPNPRNYYKCSSEGCNVKKRVERDGEDSSYVITTYDGVHNHESPSLVYFNQMPLMVPHILTLQTSSPSSSSS